MKTKILRRLAALCAAAVIAAGVAPAAAMADEGAWSEASIGLQSVECQTQDALGSATEGYWTYGYYADGTAEITGYSGSETDVVVPSKLGGYKVTAIGDLSWNSTIGKAQTLTIPSSVQSIYEQAFGVCGCPSKKYIVEAGAGVWTDGTSLINQDGVLVAYARKTGKTSYSVPEGVTKVASRIFTGDDSLEYLTLPSTLTSCGMYCFQHFEYLKSFSVASGNSHFWTDGRALYAGTKLGAYAWGSGSKYCVPEGITTIATYSLGAGFVDGTGLDTLYLPASITTSDAGEGNLASVKTVYAASQAVIDAVQGYSGAGSFVLHESHTAQAVAGRAATCTEAGLTEGSECSLCGYVLKAQQLIPALGHDWGGWVTTKAATAAEYGQASRTCRNDPSHVETVVTPKVGSAFSDVADPSAWYYGYVYRAQQLGLMSGYSDGTGRFGPGDALSRGMVVTLLYRAYTGETAATTDNEVDAGFSDVARGDYYAAAARWASGAGITTGYAGSDRFGPNDPVTREQLAAFVARYAAYVKSGGSSTDISGCVAQPDLDAVAAKADWAQVEAYAQDAMAWCNANGIVTGYSDGTGRLGPLDGANRAQMAKIIVVTVCDVLGQR